MKTLTIRPSKGVSLDKAKLALENLNFEIITNTKDSVQVSPEVLNMIDEALEEEKKGIFISNEGPARCKRVHSKNSYLNKNIILIHKKIHFLTRVDFFMKYDKINTIFPLQKKKLSSEVFSPFVFLFPWKQMLIHSKKEKPKGKMVV